MILGILRIFSRNPNGYRTGMLFMVLSLAVWTLHKEVCKPAHFIVVDGVLIEAPPGSTLRVNGIIQIL